ncbi:MAG: YbjN domain-containing protein [Phycisphaerae bacterium]|nr:YbjN domain-containing protein [Phycisphaerae bacterium]
MINLSDIWMLLGIIVGLRVLLRCRSARRGQRAGLPTPQPGGQAAGLAGARDAQPVVGRGPVKERTTMCEPRMILQQMIAFLEARQVNYRLNGDQTVIEIWFTCATAKVLVTVSVHPSGTLCVVTHVPVVIPEGRRTAMAELIARINYDLLVGGFALNLSDGNLHFRITMPLADAELTQEQFDRLIGTSLWTVERYFKAVCRLLYGGDLSPAEAVAEVEMAD